MIHFILEFQIQYFTLLNFGPSICAVQLDQALTVLYKMGFLR